MITKEIIGDKFVIPEVGQLHRSNVSKTNRALCLVVNKGYAEFDTLKEMVLFINEVESDDENFKLVGDIDKILLNSGKVVFRQRVYYSDIKKMFEVCKHHSLGIYLPPEFTVSINSILSCTGELPNLKVYAKKFGESIDTYLTTVCIVHIHCLLKSLGMYSGLKPALVERLKDKRGYMDRAPFLLGNYDFNAKTSTVLLETNINDERLYTIHIADRDILNYGYTSDNVAADTKRGVFNAD